ncbi:MAG: hypothetical protein ACI977_000828 [Candidatus Nanohaloarchaea archaeon]|jgi:hypothetical protein
MTDIERDEPKEEHKNEFENVTVLGDITVEEFSGIKERLSDKEKIQLISGVELGNIKGKKIVVVTNLRILDITDAKVSLLGEKKQFRDIKIDSIDKMEVNDKKTLDKVILQLPEGRKQELMVPDDAGLKVTGLIRDIQKNPDPADKLEKISEQHERGNISKEEFEDKKDDLVDRI